MPNKMLIPVLLSEVDVAALLGISPKSVVSYADQGTLPVPDGVRQGKYYWFERIIKIFFSNIQDGQSAYAPIAEHGLHELNTYSVYTCPAKSSRHIGTRRPKYLVLLNGGIAKVYEVTAIFTEDPVAGESKITIGNGKVDESVIDKIRKERDAAEMPKELLTYFFLGDLVAEVPSVGRQQGGTIRTESLEKAIKAFQQQGRVWTRIANGVISY